MKDKARVLKALMALAQYFEKPMPDVVQELYLRGLAEFDDAQILAALNASIKAHRFFPKVAEIIDLIQGPQPSRQDRSALAWGKLVDAIERHGSWRSVSFEDDPAIMSVVRAMGGWSQVCSWEESELQWRQRDFMQLYGGMSADGAPAYLPGRAEIANTAAGYPAGAPVRIGSGAKALPAAADAGATLRLVTKEIEERKTA